MLIHKAVDQHVDYNTALDQEADPRYKPILFEIIGYRERRFPILPPEMRGKVV